MFRVYIISSPGGGPNFSEGAHIKISSGVLIYRKISSRGNQFGGGFTMTGLPAAAWRFDRPFHMTVLRVSEVSEVFTESLPASPSVMDM